MIVMYGVLYNRAMHQLSDIKATNPDCSATLKDKLDQVETHLKSANQRLGGVHEQTDDVGSQFKTSRDIESSKYRGWAVYGGIGLLSFCGLLLLIVCALYYMLFHASNIISCNYGSQSVHVIDVNIECFPETDLIIKIVWMQSPVPNIIDVVHDICCNFDKHPICCKCWGFRCLCGQRSHYDASCGQVC